MTRVVLYKISCLAVVLMMAYICQPVEAASASCSNGRQLNVVAHEDDDLLFLSPDLANAVRAGKCVRTVFVTAGDANGSAAYWGSREKGARAAYAKMAGVANNWAASVLKLNGRNLAVSTLNDSPQVSLVFLRLPDGNGDGSGFPNTGYGSLQKLWLGKISGLTTVNGSSSYTKTDLINTLSALMTDYQANDIRTQNYTDYFAEGDHSDHVAAAFFARQAAFSVAGRQISGYLGYQSTDRPVNVAAENLNLKNSAFFVYGAHDDGVCSSWATCNGNMYGDWLQRQYIADRQVSHKSGSLRGVNLAGQASMGASSEQAGYSQTAAKAVDGSAEGWPLDHSHEWASQGQGQDAWLGLHWSTPQTINRVVLADRPNQSDQITSARLWFSDGSSQPVEALPNNGWPATVTFTNKSVTDVWLVVESVSPTTTNVGLAEIEVWTP